MSKARATRRSEIEESRTTQVNHENCEIYRTGLVSRMTRGRIIELRDHLDGLLSKQPSTWYRNISATLRGYAAGIDRDMEVVESIPDGALVVDGDGGGA